MDKVKLTQIVKEVQKDIGQFELLYSQIVNRVYYWCYTVIGNEAEAKDVAQEAMIRIYNKLHTLENPETFSSWMYILVRNVCYAFLRSRRSSDKLFLASEEFTEDFENNLREERIEVLPKEAYDLKATKEVVVKIIHALPKKQKEVITLFYLEEFKIQEIADMLDCSVGTIKSRLFDGRKSLEKNLNAYQKENNVKLYSIALLPLLGLILQEHCDEICNRQDLSYNKDIYKLSKAGKFSNSVSLVSNHIFMIVGTVLTITLVTLLALLAFPKNEENKVLSAFDFNTLLTDDMAMYDKLQGHPYIENIIYSTFPTRTTIEVTVILKEDTVGEDVKVLFEEKEVNVNSEANETTFVVEKNGVYSIKINEKRTKVQIDNIDSLAPELVDAYQKNGFLYLNVTDEKSQINYEKSYIEYNGEQYKLSSDLSVEGEFKGTIKVILYDKNENYIKYSLDFNAV